MGHKFRETKITELIYICDKCEDGEMQRDKDNPIVFMLNIPRFPHKCNKCNNESTLPVEYPITSHAFNEHIIDDGN